MTQILSFQRRNLVMMMSDRLVSTLPTLQPFDRRSNKALMLYVNDGAMLLGYTGDAFEGSAPMDSWLAGALCGEPDDGWQHAGLPNDLADLRPDQVVERLARWMDWRRDQMTPAGRSKSVLAVQFSGLRRRRNKVAGAFAGVVATTPDAESATIEIARNPGGVRAYGQVLASPLLPSEEWSVLCRELGEGLYSTPAFGDALLRGMRRASKRQGVGGDVLCITLAPYHWPPFWCTFKYRDESKADRVGDVLVSYTPWLLSPWAIFEPRTTSNGDFYCGTHPRVGFRIDGVRDSRPRVIEPGGRIDLISLRQNRSPNAADGPTPIRGPLVEKKIWLTKGNHVFETIASSPRRRLAGDERAT